MWHSVSTHASFSSELPSSSLSSCTSTRLNGVPSVAEQAQRASMNLSSSSRVRYVLVYPRARSVVGGQVNLASRWRCCGAHNASGNRSLAEPAQHGRAACILDVEG